MGQYGIDIGTSYIKVSKLENGQVLSVDMSRCITSIPGTGNQIYSGLYLLENGDFFVGNTAYNVYKRDLSRYVTQFKRELGQGVYLLGSVPYTAQKLYTEVFCFILREASLQGDPVEQVVITIPAYYTEQQKQLIQKAAAKAGMQEVKLLEEWRAAANYYASTQTVVRGEKILIYDLGGGTLDIAVIERTENGYQLLSQPRSLPSCGGILLDTPIFCDLREKVEEIAPTALNYDVFRIELAQTATKIKHYLSGVESYDESIMVGFDVLPYHIERDWYEHQIRPKLEQSLALCDRAITDADLKSQDIQRILLVGGAVAMPIVSRMLMEHYPQSLLCHTEEPEFIASYGAALYSAESVSSDTSLECRAQDGNLQAQCKLAECYLKGIGVTINKAKAFYWFNKAAEQGDKAAQFSLAMCWEFGDGTIENKTEAFRWYQKAAEQENADAQYRLAMCYDEGKGTNINKSEAFCWYKRAAEQGNINAQFSLAMCYEYGDGTAINTDLAFQWYKKAAEQEHIEAQLALASCYIYGKGTNADKAEAENWLKKADELRKSRVV